MGKIKKIIAWEVLDSRALPTVAVKIILENNVEAEAYVPSGASTGAYEAVELRDNDRSRYMGKGVLKAINNIEEKIYPKLKGQNILNQKEIDHIMIELDGSDNKKNLGANAILAVSMAVAKAAAINEKLSLYKYLLRFSPNPNRPYNLPIPMFNLLNGGCHANWASDIQEYMILAPGAKSFSQAMQMGSEVYHNLKLILKDKNYHLGLGDEGGFSPQFKDNHEPFELLSQACLKSGFSLGEDIKFAIDVAASEFYSNNYYHLKKENLKLSSEELKKYYLNLIEKYPIISLEDIFAEDDWSAFINFNKSVGKTRQTVGDDLYATNIGLIQKGINEQATNAVLIKLNQIGTLTETIEAIKLADKSGLKYIISHRSGETEDTFIADFAVAMGGGQIKTGAPARGERTAKYNRLLSIEKELGTKAIYSRFPFVAN
jgi:enolase